MGYHRSECQQTNHASHRLSHDLCRGLVQQPRHAHIDAMCGRSMTLTRFGLAKLHAAVRAMLKQYDGAGMQMATQCRITSLARPPPENKLRFSSLFDR